MRLVLMISVNVEYFCDDEQQSALKLNIWNE